MTQTRKKSFCKACYNCAHARVDEERNVSCTRPFPHDVFSGHYYCTDKEPIYPSELEGKKVCVRCRKALPLDEFVISKGKPWVYCRQCAKEYQITHGAEYRANLPNEQYEQRIKYSREYYDAHKSMRQEEYRRKKLGKL